MVAASAESASRSLPWTMETRGEAMRIWRNSAGELVERKEADLYYIDPAYSKQWILILIARLNDWQVAFESRLD